jgi:hypothetical protein
VLPSPLRWASLQGQEGGRIASVIGLSARSTVTSPKAWWPLSEPGAEGGSFVEVVRIAPGLSSRRDRADRRVRSGRRIR